MRHDVSLTDGTYGLGYGNGPFNFDMSNFNQGIDPSIDHYTKAVPGMPFYADRFWADNKSVPPSYEEQKFEEMSIDQAAALLMGLALVKKFAPDGFVWFYNTETGYNMPFNFRQCAKTNALKIAEHLREGATDGLELLEEDNIWWSLVVANSVIPATPAHPEFYGVQNWVVKNPHGDKVGREAWNARFIRYGVKKAVEEITGETFNQQTGNGASIWEFIAVLQDFSFWIGPYYSRIILANLAVVGDSWDHSLGPIQLRRTPGVIYRLLKKTKEDVRTDHELFYGLLWSALHITEWEDNYRKIQEHDYIERIESILASAPLCGPYNYSWKGNGIEQNIPFDFDGCDDCLLPNMAPPGWRAGNRFQNGPEEFKSGINDSHGIYNGIDYMMMYLLYRRYQMWHLGEHNGYAYFRNMVYSNVEQSYPFENNGTDFGTIQNPANLRTFETMNYNGSIGSASNETGSLNLIAGHKIKLTPGFHVYQGSSFSAKIEEYNCFEISNSKSSFRDNNYIKPINNDLGVMYQSKLDSDNKTAAIEIHNNSNIVLYPNPAKTEIKIACDIDTDQMIYKIFNQQGQYLFEGKLYQNKGINVNDLSNGFYYIEIFNKKGIAFREKFIVKH